MEKPASLVPLKSVFFTLALGAPRSIFRAWTEADSHVCTMAALVPEGEIDETYFHVEWTDGERYDGHLEITRPMSEAPAPLSAHVRRVLAFTAGRRCPPDMSDGEYRVFLAESERISPGRAAWAAKILDGYELPAEEPLGIDHKGRVVLRVEPARRKDRP